MKQLLIIGARGFGREVYNLFLKCKEAGLDVECKGFLDSKSDALEDFPNYPPIISSVEDYVIQPDDVFVCALGNVKYKQQYVTYMKEKGAQFISLIQGHDVKIGDWSHLGAHCFMGGFSKLGTMVTMHPGARLLPHKEAMDGSTIGAGSIAISKVKENTTVFGIPAKKIGI